MATETDIAGLPSHDWRIKDGKAQKRVEVNILDGENYGQIDPALVARRITEFIAGHDEPKIEIEHKYDDHPDYSCQTHLEMRGWQTVSESETIAARQSARAQLRTRELELETRIRAQREREERELAALRAQLDS